jgi:hypothetical protein
MTRAEEYDALTRARRFYVWTQRAGACHAVKRRYRRRERRASRVELNRERYQDGDVGR